MKTTTQTLDQYEKLVEEAIEALTLPYVSRLEVSKETYMSGPAWQIIPKNPNAATIFVYGIDAGTINVSVDDKYWLEMFVGKKEWRSGLVSFKKQLKAVMDGKATGWHDGKDHVRAKTLLEIRAGHGRPYSWSGNLLFARRFKKKTNTVEQQYESY